MFFDGKQRYEPRNRAHRNDSASITWIIQEQVAKTARSLCRAADTHRLVETMQLVQSVDGIRVAHGSI